MISRDDAQSLLSPYAADFSWCVTEAWRRWQTTHAPHIPLAFPRGRANMMYELIVDEIRKRFEGVKGIVFSEKFGRLLLNVKDRAIVRFKKLDDDLHTQNYPTQLSLKFDAQYDLPGFVSKLPRLTVGYRLNLLQTDIEKPLVVFAIGSHVQWFYELEKPVAVDVLRPSTPIFLPTKAKPTVTLKKNKTQDPEKKQASKVIKFTKPK